MLSYHLLTRSLASEACSPASLMRLAVSSALNGLVPHESYVAAAARRQASAQPEDGELAARVGMLLPFDLNPLMDVVRRCADQTQFEVCWNQLNTGPRWGVVTLLDRDADGTATRLTRREHAQEEGTMVLRQRLMSVLVSLLTSMTKRQMPGPWHQGEARSLREVASDLDAPGHVYPDLIGYLNEAPCADLSETVAALGCSRRTLQRLISSQGDGLSFMAVRQAVRIGLSKAMVRDSAWSLTQVAHALGFYDAAHFCHAFRQSCGLSPGAYRQLCRLTADCRSQ